MTFKTSSNQDAETLTLVRSATIIVSLAGLRLLVDPMLDDVGARPGVEGSARPERNPLVPLPFPADEVIAGIDAVLVTHTHSDHLDETALSLLPRNVPVLCQPEDEALLRGHRLLAQAVSNSTSTSWRGVSITRTGGQHGHGQLARELGPVSGFVLNDAYIAGDTVWCDEVAATIARFRPRTAIVNGSGARLGGSEPLVMDVGDVARVTEFVPRVIVVHLEAIGHCLETRAQVREHVPTAIVPEDGETIRLYPPTRLCPRSEARSSNKAGH
jgi:L-ascorbate metabolism protein UlaG (beta-lactamase superfamily)